MKSKEVLKKLNKFWKKFWFVVWKDDSLKGWIISIVFLFVLIKFLLLPGLSLVTGTALPLAIVESCSMYHDGNLISNNAEWWTRQDSKYSEFIINELDFKEFSFQNGFNKGDILFVIGANPDKLKIGDIIIFEANKKHPLIHRIISIEEENNEKIFSTIGDNNNGQLSVEKEISEDQLVGKAVFRIAPYLGWGKLIFYEGLRPQSERGLCEEN